MLISVFYFIDHYLSYSKPILLLLFKNQILNILVLPLVIDIGVIAFSAYFIGPFRNLRQVQFVFGL